MKPALPVNTGNTVSCRFSDKKAKEAKKEAPKEAKEAPKEAKEAPKEEKKKSKDDAPPPAEPKQVVLV